MAMADTTPRSTMDTVSEGANISVNLFVNDDHPEGDLRRLEFLSKNLGQDIDLLLIFETPKRAGELFVDVFPVYWKVISFNTTGICAAKVVYTGKTAWFIPKLNADDLVSASEARACESGQKCIIRRKSNQENCFTDPVAGTSGLIQFHNDTKCSVDIALGLYDVSNNIVQPAYMWKNIPRGATLWTAFAPKLKIYAVRRYAENQLVRGIQGPSVVWERNLINLKESTTWKVSIDKETSHVVLENM